MTKEILKYGSLSYLRKMDINVNYQTYDPVSYEQWKMLRDLEPSKFFSDYDTYVKSKKQQYMAEVEHRKRGGFEFKSVTYSLHSASIDATKQLIREIQSDELFVEWYDNELVTAILNY